MASSFLWRVPAARSTSRVGASILQQRPTISSKLSTTTVATQSKMKDWKLWWTKHSANAVPDLGKEKATQLYRDGLRALTALSQNAHSKTKDWKLGRLNHVAIAPPDLKKATQLYQDGLEALTALSRDVHSKAKDWKLGKQNHVAIAAPDFKKAMQLYRDMLGASGSVLTTLSQDIKSKAKDGQLNKITIITLLLILGVDISGMESLSDADIFVIYVKLDKAKGELEKGKITEAEYKQHKAKRSSAAIGSLAGSKAGAVIGTVMIPVPVVGAAVGTVVGCVVGDLVGEKLYITIRDLIPVKKS